MLQEYILYISYRKYIYKKKIIYMHCQELYLDNFKSDFLNNCIVLLPQIPDFQIVVSKYCPTITNHTSI